MTPNRIDAVHPGNATASDGDPLRHRTRPDRPAPSSWASQSFLDRDTVPVVMGDRLDGAPDYRIRPAAMSDVAFLTDIVIEATSAQERLPKDFDEADWRGHFSSWTEEQIRGETPGGSTSVIELGGEAVGRLRVLRDEQCIELAGIQLHPRVQGRGIGTRIVEELKDEAARTGLSLELTVERDNSGARRLYKRLGFVKVGEEDNEERFRWQKSP
jgi:ribosomal protein S18 acetylase RimI-like enzyme